MLRWRVLAGGAALVLAVTVSAHAGDVNLDPALTPGELSTLAGHLADAIEMPDAPAHPLGLTGLDLSAGAFWVSADRDAGWWRHGLGGASESLGGLVGGRVVLRKGLGFGIDVGGQVGSVAGETFWSGEVRKALLAGGAIEPAVGASLAWSRLDAGDLSMDVGTLRVTASKGFAILTPYATAGVRRLSADARWGDPAVSRSLDKTTFLAGAGVQVNLMPLAVRFELRRGETTVVFAGAGLRF